MGINLFIVSERWRLLLTTQNHHPNRFELYKLTLIGIFFNFAMPGGVGGDIVKAFYFYKDHPQSKAIAVSSVFVDRLLGLYTIIAMALGVMLLDMNHVFGISTLQQLFILFSVIFVFFNIGLFFLFSKNPAILKLVTKILSVLPFKEKFEKLYQSGQIYGSNIALLSKVFILSFLGQTFAIFIMYFTGHYGGVDSDVLLKTYFLVVPIGFMATAIPISPAGVGVGQAAFYFLFNLYLGRTSEIGPLVITMYQLILLIFGLVGAYFYLVKSQKAATISNIEQEIIDNQ